jgi:HAD superfamily hydrolase (TIGR01509 family)
LREVLADLKQTYFTAMATNRSISWKGVIGHFALSDLLDFAIGAGDVEMPKPHPEMLLRCAEHFELQPSETVYVGDQWTDVQSANSAGAHFVGIGSIAAEVAVSIDHLDELAAVVAKLGAD